MRAFFPVILGVLLASCGGDPSADGASSDAALAESATVSAAADRATVTALGVPNVAEPLPHLVTAGQPDPAQLHGMAQAGFTHFISLRLADETGAGWEEEHAADMGLDFHRLPVAGSDGLTRENVEALAHLLDQVGDEPTVLYCGSSNRVGALLALKAYWLDGASPEEAFRLGENAGMTRLAPEVGQILGLEPAAGS